MKNRTEIKSARQNHPLRIAIDSGGTFTDCVWLAPRHAQNRRTPGATSQDSTLQILKVFSTPADPAQAIAGAVLKIAGDTQDIIVLHGTTVGTNTLLQRKGARVAFVTTAGFEDSIEIGRQQRPKLYDFFFEKDPALAPAELRFGVDERTSAEGVVLRAPSADSLESLASNIAAQKPQAIAISLLFSFVNPGNEKAVAAALVRLKLPLSISHQILPEFREYERASTVLVNAYLQPVMQSYLRKLEERLSSGQERAQARVPVPQIFVMQSSGGITALSTAAEQPVRTVLSGPAGGIVGAAAVAQRSGFDRIITFDMGGTSSDVALVDGRPSTTNEADVAGLPVRVPVLDIHTVGAGGGSLARFDAGGALRVGPESAGADPGPICYGKGERPTVTDANLLLGRLPADQFLGGDFQLDLPRTQNVVAQWLKDNNSQLTPEEFAAGVVRVVNANMEKAIRVVSIERGYDPRQFSLAAFGGAGAMHACDLAQALRIPRVIVPAYPGALSALGILISDVVKDHSRTVLLRCAPAEKRDRGTTAAAFAAQLDPVFAELKRNMAEELKKEDWQGRALFEPSWDLRYRGQGYELNLPYGVDVIQRFHAEHKRRYGYSSPERDVEIVTVRMRGRVASPEKLSRLKIREEQGSLKQAAAMVHFLGKRHKTRIIPRASIKAGKSFRGPAIITEYSATTVVPPGLSFRKDGAGNLLIEIG
ncbi:MAG TPA: hydantoinase/oxoprolinase family protein [Candidatus Angelobacter sp.]|nr:hydantoinase/oxoprolinase family protein [Candidatus Angelobacter sp.]